MMKQTHLIESHPKNIKWDDNKRMSFQNHINTINKHQFMGHLAELSNQESSMCNNINEMVNYFSLTLQRAAHFNKRDFHKKGINVRKPGMTGIVIHYTGK